MVTTPLMKKYRQEFKPSIHKNLNYDGRKALQLKFWTLSISANPKYSKKVIGLFVGFIVSGSTQEG